MIQLKVVDDQTSGVKAARLINKDYSRGGIFYLR